ncbi:natural cytotoxicity triggering receptor 3 ligand 1 isoform X1 [Ranitomeya imitator]|uniref:natural cytotoxicity triggering receptor 3 ligand 1 isoform X1 n=2 Tax=Ranitomeya imitator TaxID=111125 RepID=UPI0037E8EC23
MKDLKNPLYILLISLVTADCLIVTMKKMLISAMRGDNVTIPCEFSEFSPNRIINVHWTKSQDGKSLGVYNFIPGKPEAFREGCYMQQESDIQRGNAALHIPQAQFSDDGEYTCTVIVTPESREGRSMLLVSAPPSAVLTPGDAVTVELGSEKVVSCEVTNFYPKDVTIHWVRHEKDSRCVALERGTCTGDAVSNPDGTFSVTSHQTLYPTLQDTGFKYSCLVKHRSLHQELMTNFTLTVTEREDNTGTVVAAVIGTVVAMTLLLFGGLLYHQVVKKDPPVLSEITGSDLLTDMTRTTLTFYVQNFKPNDLEISVRLRRRGEEMKTIHTWRSRAPAPSARAMRDEDAGGSSVNIDVEQQSLLNGAVSQTQGPLHLDMAAVLVPSRPGLLRFIRWQRLSTYSCQCSAHITPSYAEDNGAELSVHVSHPALTEAACISRTLRVTGVAPTLLKIVRPAYVTHEEQTTLTCPIMGFKPRTLQVTWLKVDQGGRETEIVTWNSTDEKNTCRNHEITEHELEDKSYCNLSALMMRPSVQKDNGVKYICRAYHPATEKRAEQAMVMEVTAVPVLDAIKQTEETVHVGGTMKLSCKIHSFYPRHIEATWHTDDGRILPSVTTDVLRDQSGLFHATSSMSYTPALKDRRRTFRCEVKHRSSGALKMETWDMEHLVSEPQVSDIRCRPHTPESGSAVTLSCDVSHLYPRECTVQWYKGQTKLPSDKWKETFQEDLESATFWGSIELHFTADHTCHQEDFSITLNHCGKIIEKKKKMILGASSGLPVLGDLLSEPSVPRYGQPVTLRCQVTNSHPQHITVTWLKGEKPLEKRAGIQKQITEMDGSISCSLQITATALDYGKAYSCSVTYQSVTLKKSHYLPLPDKAPAFSDITVLPERLVAGREAIFTTMISGFTPDIRVKWYKDFNPFSSDVVTTKDPEIGKDFLCHCPSSLKFTPQDSDHLTSIRCEATHSVTKKVYEQLYTLRLSGRTSEHERRPPARPPGSVKTRGIQCLPESPRVGENVTLTCYVDGCCAADSVFSWSKGMFPIDGEIQNMTVGSGSSSTVTFTAQETDRDCTITCEVTYNLQTQEEHFTLKLQ